MKSFRQAFEKPKNSPPGSREENEGLKYSARFMDLKTLSIAPLPFQAQLTAGAPERNKGSPKQRALSWQQVGLDTTSNQYFKNIL